MLLAVQNRLIVAAWAACGAYAAAVATTAQAYADQPFTIGGFSGVDIFSRDTELGNSWMVDQVPNTSVLVGLRVGWLALPRLYPAWRGQPQLEFEAEFKLAPAFTANGSTSNGDQAYFAPVFGWRAHAVGSLRIAPWLRAHVLAGAGGESVASTSPYMADETDAMVYWGVGVRAAAKELSDDWRLRLDARHGFTAGRGDSLASTVELHLGVETSFGTGPARRSRRPRVEPVLRNKPTPGDGGEHVGADAVHVNTDNDAVAATLDNPAPAHVEPAAVADTDADGIANTDDKCPDASETRNGFLDADGCPNLVPAVLRDSPFVEFPRGSAKLGPKATQQLTEVASVLRATSELKLSLVGYDAGGGKTAARLRERRVSSIQWFLLDRGIAAERLSAATESSNDSDPAPLRSGQADRIELRIAP